MEYGAFLGNQRAALALSMGSVQILVYLYPLCLCVALLAKGVV